MHTALCHLLSNINISIDKTVEEGAWISALCTVKAKSQKKGIAVKFHGNVFVRIENDKIIQAYNNFDFMSLWIQPGLLPENSFEKGLSDEKIG